MATDNSDQLNFRVGSKEKKDEFINRTKSLRKSKKISSRDIYEAGLRVFEKGESEQQILDRRSKTISERDVFFNLFIDRNSKLVAYNRRLRNKNKRYNNYKDDKDVILVYDKDGNKLNQIDLTEDDVELKKQIEKDFK